MFTNNQVYKDVASLLLDNLTDSCYKSQVINVYSLSDMLLETINYDGVVFYSTAESKEYIKDNFDDIGYICDDKIEQYGDFTYNGFADPDKFLVEVYNFVAYDIIDNIANRFKENENFINNEYFVFNESNHFVKFLIKNLKEIENS